MINWKKCSQINKLCLEYFNKKNYNRPPVYDGWYNEPKEYYNDIIFWIKKNKYKNLKKKIDKIRSSKNNNMN